MEINDKFTKNEIKRENIDSSVLYTYDYLIFLSDLWWIYFSFFLTLSIISAECRYRLCGIIIAPTSAEAD